MEKARKLSFELIDEKVDQYVLIQELRNRAGPYERWSYAIGLFVVGLCLPIGTFVGGATGVWIVRAGLVAECLGLGICFILMVRREWRTFAHSRRVYATELDQDYRKYRECVNWLRQFPRKDIQTRLRYIESRRNTMVFRMSLFTGGLERLGVIPIFVMLYLQFKDWRLGDWDALGKVNLVGGLLLWALLLCYLMSWWLIGLRSRVEAYEALLKEAAVEDN